MAPHVTQRDARSMEVYTLLSVRKHMYLALLLISPFIGQCCIIILMNKCRTYNVEIIIAFLVLIITHPS